MNALQLVFTKGAGKHDRLKVVRGDHTETIECPKQRIIPHDMVHYAVESILSARGFLGRVASGEAASFTMTAETESDGVERLVEVFQADGWSGETTSADEMIALYRVTCEARGCPMLSVDAATIEAVRVRIGELTARWEAVPVGGTLQLDFSPTG